MVEYFRVGLPYIRIRFRVPARRGGRVELGGRFGIITGASGEHVLVRFDGEPRPSIVHPVELNYVEAGEATEHGSLPTVSEEARKPPPE
ncbi:MULTISPECIES: hypothetical protein [unclassified Variovorax]|jgi:hypothetical protein|uniref:hypothetical protein n=1 Tax=unclassified Variovorax TaxID=663243 RepID=UPI000F7D67CC|nr:MULTISPECIES: hypothetical protein [unclassified Variovorax]RSZ39467.1 hypothetical protein EJO70_15840 [Variovorax sp. 553]RSZ40829.1 hypothetical protein EJO71_18380 [Variovorax sp. 679]